MENNEIDKKNKIKKSFEFKQKKALYVTEIDFSMIETPDFNLNVLTINYPIKMDNKLKKRAAILHNKIKINKRQKTNIHRFNNHFKN